MKLFEFLDIKYRQTALSLQQQFSPYTDGKAKGAVAIIGFQRWLGKWLSIPWLLLEFLLVKAKLVQEPLSPDAAKKPPKPKLEAVTSECPAKAIPS